jgi:hypothetical protein
MPGSAWPAHIFVVGIFYLLFESHGRVGIFDAKLELGLPGDFRNFLLLMVYQNEVMWGPADAAVCSSADFKCVYRAGVNGRRA